MLDLAARWADPGAVLTLDTVHRFADPEYADLSLAMRTGTDPGDVFDKLAVRGEVVVHDSELARTAALADEGTLAGTLVVADTREQVADLNATIRDRLVARGQVDDRRVLVTQAGERVGAGDRIATRRNDYDLGVANRDTWTVERVERGGTLHLSSGRRHRAVDPDYASAHVELAYATTAYGAQGETTRAAHLLLGDKSGASSAYVAMTRGREANTVHLVAESLDDARRQWIDTFSRDRADLGPTHAAQLASEEASKYAVWRPRVTEASPERPVEAAPRVRRPPEPSPWGPSAPARGPGIGF